MDGGLTVDIKGNTIDNRWTVPYNPLLSYVFQAHINVKACYSVFTEIVMRFIVQIEMCIIYVMY